MNEFSSLDEAQNAADKANSLLAGTGAVFSANHYFGRPFVCIYGQPEIFDAGAFGALVDDLLTASRIRAADSVAEFEGCKTKWPVAWGRFLKCKTVSEVNALYHKLSRKPQTSISAMGILASHRERELGEQERRNV